MSCIRAFAPLARPLLAPRAFACPQHFHYTTTTRLRADQPSKPSLPPNTATSTPSEPTDAARAADLAATEATTESDSAQPVQQKPALPSQRPTGSVKPLTDGLTSFVDSPVNSSSDQSPSKSKQPPTTPSKPKTASSSKSPRSTPNITLPPPRYHVSRSANKNLPIYTDFKRGGNLHLTTVRKLTGDIAQLRDELKIVLNKKEGDVKINTLTQQVIVKGHHKPEISSFLTSRGM